MQSIEHRLAIGVVGVVGGPALGGLPLQGLVAVPPVEVAGCRIERDQTQIDADLDVSGMGRSLVALGLNRAEILLRLVLAPKRLADRGTTPPGRVQGASALSVPLWPCQIQLAPRQNVASKECGSPG